MKDQETLSYENRELQEEIWSLMRDNSNLRQVIEEQQRRIATLEGVIKALHGEGASI